MTADKPQGKAENADLNRLEVEVPEGVEVSIDASKVKITGPKGTVERDFDLSRGKLSMENNKIILTLNSKKRADKAQVGSVRAHVQNMINGVTSGVTYKMKIVYSHFPMNVKVQGETFIIDNFLGEKHPRKATIIKDVKVDVKGQDLTISGIDKENVSQTAANIEQATKVRGRDSRTFQDGIYIIDKNGKSIR